MLAFNMIRAIIALLVFVFLAVVALNNMQQQVTLNCLFGHQYNGSLGLVLFVCLVVGALQGLASARLLLTAWKNKQVEHQSNWQEQDVKLAAEIKSDREKQLEAKVATLEAALKQALKKS